MRLDGQIFQLAADQMHVGLRERKAQPKPALRATARVVRPVKALCEMHALLLGNLKIATPLSFVRFEPCVVPKQSLTGDNTERVDPRVLQVIFSFTRGELPIFVGQQMDVLIDAPQLLPTPAASGSGGRP